MPGQEVSKYFPVSDIEKMAQAIASSKLFGMKTPQEAMALMLVAQSEGRHPASAAKDYHVIQNKPTLKASTLLARFQNKGGRVEFPEYTDKVVTGKFYHPQGGALSITWSWERAQKIGLTTKDSWKKYPRAMLRSRVISEGVMTLYPAVSDGMYTPEEVENFVPQPSPKKTVETEAIVTNEKPKPEAPKPIDMPESLKDYLEKNTETVDLYLKIKKLIKPEQTWKDLDQGYIERMAKNPLAFAKAVEQFSATLSGKM